MLTFLMDGASRTIVRTVLADPRRSCFLPCRFVCSARIAAALAFRVRQIILYGHALLRLRTLIGVVDRLLRAPPPGRLDTNFSCVSLTRLENSFRWSLQRGHARAPRLRASISSTSWPKRSSVARRTSSLVRAGLSRLAPPGLRQQLAPVIHDADTSAASAPAPRPPPD